jgi:hypothetical protein
MGVLGVGLLIAAIVKERRLPPRKRRGYGKVLFFPYDLRRPTLARLRERMFNPDGPLIGPHVFGVGWTLNLGRLWALVGRR